MNRATFCLGSLATVATVLSPDLAHADAPPAPTGNALDFLKWSMDKHAALKSYQAKGTWELQFEKLPELKDDKPDVFTRTIAYIAPNQFKITSGRDKPNFIYVCDGKRYIAKSITNRVETFPAPDQLPDAEKNGGLSHPHFGGSALYQFFGGAKNIDRLLDENRAKRIQKREPTPVRFGSDTTVNGVKCKTVLFGGGLYDHERRAFISLQDGLVRRLESYKGRRDLTKEELAERAEANKFAFDSETFKLLPPEKQAEMRKQMEITFLPATTTVEIYTDIVTNALISPETFATNIEGAKPVAPVAVVNEPAPLFSVRGTDGKMVLSQGLKGHVVLIDFWATWCPPCVKGLPDTLALHRAYKNKGLTVLAVTAEKQETVEKWLKDKKMTDVPVFYDNAGQVNKTYGITAIPTLVVIDRKGTLVARFVGLQEPDTIKAALAKAGLKI